MRSFRKQVILWLILVPVPLGVILGSIFLGLILSSAFASAVAGIGVLAGAYLLAAVVYSQQVSDAAEPLRWAVKNESEVSEAASEALQRLIRLIFYYWFGSAGLAAVAGTIIVLPSFLGFIYFLAAGLIVATFGTAFSYFTSKLLIVSQIRFVDEFYYKGQIAPIGRKVSLIFLGIFTISSLAFVLLGSAQISTTLETLAVSSQENRFQELEVLANSAIETNDLNMDVLDSQIPPGFRLARIFPEGGATGSAAGDLSERDIEFMQEMERGDSTSFISSNVTRFAKLDDGSTLVMTIPWEPYQAVTRQIAVYALVVAFLGLAQFVIVIYYFARDTNRPLRALSRTATELAEGDFRGRIRVFADDEIGELAHSFLNTRNRLRALLGSVTSSGEEVHKAVAVIARGSQSLLEQASQQTTLTGESVDSILAIQEQSKQIYDAADQVSSALEDSASRAIQLRASAEEVSRRSDELFQSVEKTSSSTTEMNASAAEMTNRTSHLADIGSEVLSFVAEMDATARELRNAAESSAAISKLVREKAETGGTAVTDTVEGIRAAQDSTRRSADTLDDLRSQIAQISKILTVIEDITERTNLLSLNAAIIAAQAGEHGLGFGVVAEEIRELAERTRGSTKEIAGIIKAVEKASGEAVAAMNEGVATVDANVSRAQSARSSLDQILESAENSFQMASRMASSLQEQASASQRLHEVTSKMSESIGQIDTSTREQARSTQLLASEAEKVSEIAEMLKNSTIEQKETGRGISDAIERISSDLKAIRDLIGRQLDETSSVATASEALRGIATDNEAVAREFSEAIESLERTAQTFETEIERFQT